MAEKLPSLAGNGVLAIWSDLDLQREDQFDTWHVHEHLIERVNVPGFLRARRYASLQPISRGAVELFTLYETENVAVMQSDAYLQRLENPTPLTQATVPLMERMRRSALRVVASEGHGIGGYLSVTHFRHPVDATLDHRLREVLENSVKPTGVMAAHALAPEVEATKAKDSTAEGKATKTVPDAPQWLLLVESLHERALMEAQSSVAEDLKQVSQDAKVTVEHYKLAVLLDGPASI